MKIYAAYSLICSTTDNETRRLTVNGPRVSVSHKAACGENIPIKMYANVCVYTTEADGVIIGLRALGF